eukprot:scaffold112501_cov15-Tisochrysis_lutea.AAC.1
MVAPKVYLHLCPCLETQVQIQLRHAHRRFQGLPEWARYVCSATALQSTLICAVACTHACETFQQKRLEAPGRFQSGLVVPAWHSHAALIFHLVP